MCLLTVRSGRPNYSDDDDNDLPPPRPAVRKRYPDSGGSRLYDASTNSSVDHGLYRYRGPPRILSDLEGGDRSYRSQKAGVGGLANRSRWPRRSARVYEKHFNDSGSSISTSTSTLSSESPVYRGHPITQTAKPRPTQASVPVSRVFSLPDEQTQSVSRKKQLPTVRRGHDSRYLNLDKAPEKLRSYGSHYTRFDLPKAMEMQESVVNDVIGKLDRLDPVDLQDPSRSLGYGAQQMSSSFTNEGDEITWKVDVNVPASDCTEGLLVYVWRTESRRTLGRSTIVTRTTTTRWRDDTSEKGLEGGIESRWTHTRVNHPRGGIVDTYNTSGEKWVASRGGAREACTEKWDETRGPMLSIH